MDKNDVIKSIRYNHELSELLRNSKEILLYGAGYAGKEFYSKLPEEIKNKVSFFVVSDTSNFVQKEIEGVPVISVDVLKKESTALILITIIREEKRDVAADLQKRGIRNVYTLDWEVWLLYNMYFSNLDNRKKAYIYSASKNWELRTDIAGVLYGKMLNLAKFISSCHTEQVLPAMSFTWGGSGVLDYLLLRTLVAKYQLKSYFEIGTYIGDSIAAVSDLAKTCYSVSVPEDHPAHMKNWCKTRHMNDYSGKLVKGDNVVPLMYDSKFFPWDEFKDKVDLYFIDGDHSFQGVLVDSLNIAERMDWENDIIVWHDCRSVFILEEVVEAIRMALGEHFDNFYIFDNCMCGIYLPPKYKKDFAEVTPEDKLLTYRIQISANAEIE